MLPFSRVLVYDNVATLPVPLVYLPFSSDIANHGDSTNPKYPNVNFTVQTATLGAVQGRTGLFCNGAQRLYYDEVVMANTSWSAMQWVYTTSTAAKAYINASANVGFSYNTGGTPSMTRNFYCVNSGSSTNSYFGNFTMPVNEWVHVVYTYERSTNILKFYANGTLIRSQSVPTFSTYGAGNATQRSVGLGYYPSNVTATPLAGYISSHRLYDYLIDDSMVKRIYDSENII